MRKVIYNVELEHILDESAEREIIERKLSTDDDLIAYLKQEIYEQGFAGLIPRKLDISIEK